MARQILIIIGLVIFINACSVYTRVDYSDIEGALPANFFDQLRDEHTQTDWVMAHLGEPREAMELYDGSKIYTWQLAREKRNHLSVFYVLRYNTQEMSSEYLHVHSHEGTVKNHWRDNQENIREDKLDDLTLAEH